MPPSPNSSRKDGPIEAFVAAVDRSLSRHRMVDPGERILVAVSGGPDSVALLSALHRLAPRRQIGLAVAHLHHGIRGAAADADARRSRRLARLLGLPFIMKRVDTAAEARRARLSLEAAGRDLRYAFLKEAAALHGCCKIALGHQRNDNAELVLMNLIRGSGSLGLAAMPPMRDDCFIRPLLEIDRCRIMAFVKAVGADCGEDETNYDLNHTRNWIRRVLLPLIADRANPAIVTALNRTAAIGRDEETWLAGIVEDLYRSALIAETPDRVVLDAGILRPMAPAACRRVLRHAVGRLRQDLHRLGMAHIDAAASLLTEAGPGRRIDLPHRLRISASAGRLEIRSMNVPLRQAVVPTAFRYTLKTPGRIAIPELGLEVLATIYPSPAPRADLGAGQWSAFFDINVVSFPLVVRSAIPGDRFRPLGAGGHQKVAKFLIDHKVPQPLRPGFPVVESGGRIVWLAGQRIAEATGANADSDGVLALVIRPTDMEKDFLQ